MSRTKDHYEQRAEELGLDIELTEETIDRIIQAEADPLPIFDNRDAQSDASRGN